jgi:alkanesulfonate monooxygenase SsuD/methylene tetrahydromethanopterin reductase-like flavin-dependent oxidoreductase (luciferase family)
MKIGVELRLGGADAAELLADARAFEAAGADSLWVVARDGQDPWILGAALAASTWRARLVVVDAVERPHSRETLERLSRGRLAVGERSGDATLVPDAEGATERWSLCPMPAGRAEWKALRAARETEGFAGVVLPNDPRTLDLVRNPDVEDDRQDLKLAFG